jgi:hypothetical protein
MRKSERSLTDRLNKAQFREGNVKREETLPGRGD